MRIHAIVGSRTWANRDAVERYVDTLALDTHVISGGASGPDSWAVEHAQRRGMTTTVYRMRVDVHPSRSAHERNTEIAARCDCLTAFVDYDSPTHGARDAVMKALVLGKFVQIIVPLAIERNVERAPRYDRLARYLTERIAR